MPCASCSSQSSLRTDRLYPAGRQDCLDRWISKGATNGHIAKVGAGPRRGFARWVLLHRTRLRCRPGPTHELWTQTSRPNRQSALDEFGCHLHSADQGKARGVLVVVRIARSVVVVLVAVLGATACAPPPSSPQPEFFGVKAIADGPQFMTSDGSNLWVSAPASNSVLKVRPFDGAVLQRFEGGGVRWSAPSQLEFDGVHLWVVSSLTNEVIRFDPASGSVVAKIPVGSFPFGIEFDGSNMWVSNLVDPDQGLPGSVTKIRTADNTVVGTYHAGVGVRHLHFDGQSLWVSSSATSQVWRLNPTSGALIQTVEVGPGPAGMTSDAEFLYVTVLDSDSVVKVRKSEGTVTDVLTVQGRPIAVALAGGTLWVVAHRQPLLNQAGSLYRLDGDGAVLQEVPLGVASWDVLPVGGRVWATSLNSGSLTKVLI